MEKPILFSGSMVRAILDGRKTQTRRVRGLHSVNTEPDRWECDTVLPDGTAVFNRDKGQEILKIRCPYDKPGDNLWVRERQRVVEIQLCGGRVDKIRVDYEADGTRSEPIPYPDRLKGKPRCGYCLSYGGYRESSRIDLAVKSVRVERLQEISDEDAKAEGLLEWTDPPRVETKHYGVSRADVWETDPRQAFARLWDSINEKRGFGWDTNPWVWVVEFEVGVTTEIFEETDSEQVAKKQDSVATHVVADGRP